MQIRLTELLRIALSSVRNNLLRSTLTLLIIAFGITALVGILTAIDSILFSMNDSFSGLGANSFSIAPRNEEIQSSRGGRQVKRGEPISLRQAESFKNQFDFPGRVSVSFVGSSSASVRHTDGKTNPNVTIRGIDENYLDASGLDLVAGRNFTRTEIDDGSPRVIVGQDIVNMLFDGSAEASLDQVVSAGNSKYRVIGVIASKGSNMGQSTDRQVLIPLQNVKRYYGTTNTNYEVKVGLSHAADMDHAVVGSIGLFRIIRRLKAGQENDFEIFKSDEILDILRKDTIYLRMATIAIGLITLLGAAIGLMNIMLVAVAERTKEIGVRKAVGASNKNILTQFLIEAVLICQVGGILGVLFGIFIGNIVSLLIGSPFLVPWAWIILGLIVCTVVGLVSGLYPALKAAKLDPIESLRYE